MYLVTYLTYGSVAHVHRYESLREALEEYETLIEDELCFDVTLSIDIGGASCKK